MARAVYDVFEHGGYSPAAGTPFTSVRPIARGDVVDTMPASDLVKAQWVSERRGLVRFHTEQPPYSILNRGIENEVLPVAQEYGIGTLVWSPLAGGRSAA